MIREAGMNNRHAKRGEWLRCGEVTSPSSHIPYPFKRRAEQCNYMTRCAAVSVLVQTPAAAADNLDEIKSTYATNFATRKMVILSIQGPLLNIQINFNLQREVQTNDKAKCSLLLLLNRLTVTQTVFYKCLVIKSIEGY